MSGHSSWDEVKRRRVEDEGRIVSEWGDAARAAQAVTRNRYCQCDDHLSIRMTTRIREAEDAARAARSALASAAEPGALGSSPYVGAAELERLARTARLHDMLAEALRAVLDGGF